jgi:subtilisin family serine protease
LRWPWRRRSRPKGSIGVTATDEDDKPFSGANQGPQVAAPGVNILEPAPNAGYQVTTGTSVAAAHVSGVAALLIEKNPSLKPDAVFELLTSSAKTLGAKGRDDQTGWGLVDPAKALAAADEKVAIDEVLAQPASTSAKPPAKPATPKPAAGAVSAR